MRSFTCGLFLILATLAVYASVPSAALVWNDRATLAQSQQMTWQPQDKAVFAPLAPAIWRGLDQLSHGSPAPTQRPQLLHTTNLVIHVGSVLLLFMILMLLLQSEGAAFLGAAWFALHPLQSEAVIYVSSFKVVLGSFFALLALWQFLRYVLSVQAGPRKRQGRRAYHVATVAYILAVLADPRMVVVPALAYLLSRLLPKQTSLYHTKVPLWGLGVWSLLGIAPMFWAIRSQDTAVLTQVLPLWLKPLVAGDALSFYMAKTLVPLGIGPDYGRSPILVMNHWWGYGTWLLPLVVLLIVSSSRSKTRDWHSAPLLIFFVALAPSLGLVYFEAQATSTVAGRYAYLAGLGPALMIAFLVARARRLWVPLVVGTAITICGLLTARGLQHWQNDDALWRHALSVNPLSPIAHAKQGDKAMKEGDWQSARGDYLQVLAANAFSPTVYYNLGEIERLHGDARKATEYYGRALQLAPSMAAVYDKLGSTYLALGDHEAALSNFIKATQIAPNDEESLRLLGMLLVRKGAYAESIPYLVKATAISDGGGASLEHRAEGHALLGLALNNTQQRAAAKVHLEAAMQLAPDSKEANRTLADIYFAQGEYPLARSRYEKAVAAGATDFQVFNALGMISSLNKEYSKAIPYFASALSLQPNAAETLKDIGIAYFHLRQQKDATASFKKAIEVNPNLAAPHFYLGELARWQGKEPEAVHEYQAALRIDPAYAEANFRLGNVYLKNDQLTLAIQQFQQGLRSTPEEPKLLYGLKKAEKARDTAAAVKRDEAEITF